MMPTIRKISVKIQNQIAKSRLKNQKDDVLMGPPPSGLSQEVVREKMKKVPFWWHHIELGYGIVTPGHHGGIHHPTGDKNLLKNMQLPNNLAGRSILDIGAWDGFYSFEAEKRGAAKVLAIDNFYRDSLEWTGCQGFEVAKEILNSKVEFKKASVYDLNPETFGTFDIVLFLGVLYLLRHPLLALEKIFSVTKETLIMETHYDPYHVERKTPLAAFYEGSEIGGNPTIWWGLNEACLHACLRSVGFKNPKTLYRYGDRIIIKADKPR